MKRYRLGITLFISLILHALLLFFLFERSHIGLKKGSGEHRIKASFKEISSFDSQSSIPIPPKKKKKIQNTQTNNPKQAPQQKSKKPEKPAEKKETPTKETKNTTQKKPQETPQETPENQNTQEEKDTNSFQSSQEDGTQEESIPDFKQNLAYQFADASTKKNISEFYGPEFGYLGKEEQEYIINNLAYIGRITQKYLRYPANAAMLQQGGGNVVEFYLHPNGDISDLKIIKKSGFILLDRNSIKTIEIAYKDYPHPKTKTLIRFYINYFIRYR